MLNAFGRIQQIVLLWQRCRTLLSQRLMTMICAAMLPSKWRWLWPLRWAFKSFHQISINQALTEWLENALERSHNGGVPPALWIFGTPLAVFPATPLAGNAMPSRAWRGSADVIRSWQWNWWYIFSLRPVGWSPIRFVKWARWTMKAGTYGSRWRTMLWKC